MKFQIFKYVAALVVGIIVGISTASVANLMLTRIPSVGEVDPPVREPLGAAAPHELDKVVIHFKGFDLYKDWVARFEVINRSTRPVLYVGLRDNQELSFCNIAAQRNDIGLPGTAASGFAMRDHCLFADPLLQTLEPGESLVFAVEQHQVQPLVRLDEGFGNVQIGFEFFVGEERRRKVFWSEGIIFPNDPG